MPRSLLLLAALALLITLLPASAAAQADTAPPALVHDINPGRIGYSSEPGGIAALGDQLFFSAIAPGTGRELWASDGTPEGTHLVADLAPGIENGDPTLITPVGDRLFFMARDRAYRADLWVSDGTPTGARLAYNFPDDRTIWLSGLTDLGGRLLFFVSDLEAGASLWRSDGTSEGTTPVRSAFLDRDTRVEPVVTLGSTSYFLSAQSNKVQTPQAILWRSDGTAAGTMPVLTLSTGVPFESWSLELIGTIDGVFYLLLDRSTEREIWRSDGTAAGTRRLDPGPGATFRTGTIFDGALFTVVKRPDQQVELRKDSAILHTFTEREGSQLYQLTPAASQMYFAAGGAAGIELWASDGTPAGTRQIADLNPGPSSSTPVPLAAIGNQLFLIAYDPTEGRELWSSDGTAAGTRRLTSVLPGSQGDPEIWAFVTWGGRLFFHANDRPHGAELWASDGTPAGTGLLADIEPTTAPASASPQGITALGDKVIFLADDGVHGSEPWVSDGTAAGTRLLGDLVPGPDGDLNRWGTLPPQLVGNQLWFTSLPPQGGPTRLYATDGTPAGTRRLIDLPQGTNRWAAYGTQLALMVYPTWDTNHFELWLSDGTAAGTRRIGAFTGTYDGLVVVGGILHLTVLVDDAGALYRIDPTGAISQLYRADQRQINSLVDYGGALYFTDGRALIRSDGTPKGATVIAAFTSNGPLVRLGDRLLLLANRGPDGYEIWASDGTTQGTTLIHSIPRRGDRFWYLWAQLVVVGDLAYLNYQPLWRSDGTAEGTFPLWASVAAYTITPVGDRALFLGEVGWENWQEIWASRGDLPTTRMLYRPEPPWLATPLRQLVPAGPRVFFQMGDLAHGAELWSMGANLQPPPLVPQVWMPAAGR